MKRDIHKWISDYGVSHKNPTNKKIHWLCVPIIMFTLLGLLSMVKFYSINHISSYLLIPYLIWLIFAIYLNLYIIFKNKHI